MKGYVKFREAWIEPKINKQTNVYAGCFIKDRQNFYWTKHASKQTILIKIYLFGTKTQKCRGHYR